MTIPNDILKREWIDASNNNPQLVDMYRPCLIAFLAFNKDHYPEFVGSGFIIGGGGEYVLAITAKHVLTGAAALQRPSRYASSALFIPETSTHPSIKESDLRVCFMDSDNADLLFTRHLGFNNDLDIACGIFQAQQAFKENFKPNSVLIDVREPSVGDLIHMITLDKLDISNYCPPTDKSGAGFSFALNRRVCIRVGTVTNVYPDGLRQHKFPCFSTSIPAEPGMSGGMVFVPRDNQPISICGIVSSDFSSDESRLDETISGESLIASAWPSLCLPIPEAYHSDAAQKSIYELMKNQQIPKAVGLEYIYYQDLGNGNCRIKNTYK